MPPLGGSISSSKFAIITPYYNESPAFLRRCIESVARQTVPVEHLLIADGVAQSWLDNEPIRHIKLDKSHRDYGNTPRGIGSLLAISEGFDGFGFLDADNWLEPKHVQLCAQFGTGFDYVIAQRHFRRPDETIMLVQDETSHVDTNCLFLLRSAFFVAPFFSMMPKEVSNLSGVHFSRRTAAPPKRNAPCECGSGLKYKHCHGKLAAM